MLDNNLPVYASFQRPLPIFWQHVASTIRFVHAKFPIVIRRCICGEPQPTRERHVAKFDSNPRSNVDVELGRRAMVVVVVVLCIYYFQIINNAVFVEDESFILCVQ